jgi:hypothetical protein
MASSQQRFDADLKDPKADVTCKDVINIILGYAGLDPVSGGHGDVPLVSTLFNSIKTQKLTRLRMLLTATVSGMPDEIKKILEEDPSLASTKWEEKENIIALSGHQFNRITPYQAALSVGDTQIAALIKSYFDNEEEADRQFNEQCPKGWEKPEEEEAKWQRILQHLAQVLLPAICESKEIISSGDPDYIITLKEGSPVEKALLKFWDLLDAALNEVITVGNRAFYDDLLLKTLQIYDNEDSNTKYFGGRLEDPRALLYAQKVIGYEGIQGLMPVNYVQGFQECLSETEHKLRTNESQGRSTRFKIFRGHNDFIPVDFYPRPGRMSPGSNFMICGSEWAERGGVGTAVSVGLSFEAYVNQKKLCLQKGMRAPEKEKTPKLT